MGFLEEATPLPWSESTEHFERLKANGIAQFLAIFRAHASRRDPVMLWGDEQEYALVEVGPGEADVRLALRAHEALPLLRARAETYEAANPAANAGWAPEMGNHMVEGVTKPPYKAGLDELRLVEESLAFRRRELSAVAASVATRGWRSVVWTFANFPLLGTELGQAPAAPPTPQRDDGLGSRSRFVPDEVITPHPRFLAFVANIRLRKGAKTAALLPMAADASGAPCAAAKESPRHTLPWTLADAEEETDDPVPGRIYLDAAAFGAGSCCTQATFLCPSLSDARYLYDQLMVLAPLFLPLTASTPFWRGRVAATDTRIDAFSQTWDDRTPSETEAEAPRMSRAATVPQVYLADTGPLQQGENQALYNDLRFSLHEPSLQTLKEAGVDELLAQHVAHIFARDFLNVFRERLEVDNETMGDHWEQLQSSNWGTVRFKPPPAANANPGGAIGWRVELRTPEAAPTDFENAAVVCVARVLAELILLERWDLYIPLSDVEQNLQRSAASGMKHLYRFRADFLDGGGYDAEKPRFGTFTLKAIFFGSEGRGVFARCLAYMQQKQLQGECSQETLDQFTRYVELFRRRSEETLSTPAAWLRQRLAAHPAYEGGSEVPRSFLRDMALLAQSLAETPRSPEAAEALRELLGDLVDASA